jgi:hypothetical protein
MGTDGLGYGCKPDVSEDKWAQMVFVASGAKPVDEREMRMW